MLFRIWIDKFPHYGLRLGTCTRNGKWAITRSHNPVICGMYTYPKCVASLVILDEPPKMVKRLSPQPYAWPWP